MGQKHTFISYVWTYKHRGSMNSECYFIKTEQNKAKSQSFYIHIKLWQTVPLEMSFLLFCFTLPFYVETSLSSEQGQQT